MSTGGSEIVSAKVSLLRLLHVPNIKAALRDLAANARKIFAMLRM